MKHTCLALALALGLCLAPAGVFAKPQDLAEYTRYDLDGDGKEDRAVFTEERRDGVSYYTIYVNGKKCGSYATAKDMELYDTSAVLVETRSGDHFFVFNGTNTMDEGQFLVFQFQKGRFPLALETDTVIQAKRYMTDYSHIVFQEGTDQFVVTSQGQSSSLCRSTSIIKYVVKDHKLVKKSKTYKTNTYPPTYRMDRKMAVYKKPGSTQKVLTLKKKEEVKVTKVYDGKKLWVYIQRLSDGKGGWAAGIRNFSDPGLFDGIEYPETE